MNIITKVLIKRSFSSVILLFLLISLIFILLRVSPGNPAQKYVSPELSRELQLEVRKALGLDGNILEQYYTFMSHSLQGDFGVSFQYRRKVTSVIFEYLPLTIFLANASIVIQLFFSFWLAVISFEHRGKALDKFLSASSMIIYSIPTFVIAIILLFLFAFQLKILPSSDLSSIDHDSLSGFQKILDYASHLILPLITLSLGGTIIFYKYLRDNLNLTAEMDFVKYLKSIGTAESVILKKHIIPNSISPFISVVGIEAGLLLGGALITEVIYNLPGMGRLTVNAILMRDYPLVIGCTLISGILTIAANFLADLIKVQLDKRSIEGL